MSPLDVPETPCVIPVRIVCPVCRQALQVELPVTSVLTAETDEDDVTVRILSTKVKSQKLPHLCGQQTLDDGLPFRGDVS